MANYFLKRYLILLPLLIGPNLAKAAMPANVNPQPWPSCANPRMETWDQRCINQRLDWFFESSRGFNRVLEAGYQTLYPDSQRRPAASFRQLAVSFDQLIRCIDAGSVAACTKGRARQRITNFLQDFKRYSETTMPRILTYISTPGPTATLRNPENLAELPFNPWANQNPFGENASLRSASEDLITARQEMDTRISELVLSIVSLAQRAHDSLEISIQYQNVMGRLFSEFLLQSPRIRNTSDGTLAPLNVTAHASLVIRLVKALSEDRTLSGLIDRQWQDTRALDGYGTVATTWITGLAAILYGPRIITAARAWAATRFSTSFGSRLPSVITTRAGGAGASGTVVGSDVTIEGPQIQRMIGFGSQAPGTRALTTVGTSETALARVYRMTEAGSTSGSASASALLARLRSFGSNNIVTPIRLFATRTVGAYVVGASISEGFDRVGLGFSMFSWEQSWDALGWATCTFGRRPDAQSPCMLGNTILRPESLMMFLIGQRAMMAQANYVAIKSEFGVDVSSAPGNQPGSQYSSLADLRATLERAGERDDLRPQLANFAELFHAIYQTAEDLTWLGLTTEAIRSPAAGDNSNFNLFVADTDSTFSLAYPDMNNYIDSLHQRTLTTLFAGCRRSLSLSDHANAGCRARLTSGQAGGDRINAPETAQAVGALPALVYSGDTSVAGQLGLRLE